MFDHKAEGTVSAAGTQGSGK